MSRNMQELVNSMVDMKSAPAGVKRTPESIEAYAKQKAALNTEAETNWTSPAWHREVADMIAARLDYTINFENPVADAIDTMVVGPQDQVVEEDYSGLQAFYTARGAYIDETQMVTKRWSMGRDTIGFHVSEFEDKLRVNFATSMENMIALGSQAMASQIALNMFNTFETAVNSSAPQYINASSGLTATILNSAITAVHDAIRPHNMAMPNVTILGRRGAVDEILTVATGSGSYIFDPGATEEIRATGKLGVYRGATIQVVPNYYDNTRTSLLPANELWVLAGNVGKQVYYGPAVTKTWIENTRDYVHYRTRKDVGFAIWHPEWCRRIVLGA